jgi:hypothetical protein
MAALRAVWGCVHPTAKHPRKVANKRLFLLILSLSYAILEHMFEGLHIGFGDAPDHPTIPAADWDGASLVGPDALVTHSLNLPLGANALALLTAADYSQLTDAGRALALQQLELLSSNIDAEKARLMAAIAGPAPISEQARRDDFSAQDVAVATNCSVYLADSKIAVARDLARRFTASAAAMLNGDITLAQARALSEATSHLDDDTAREIEAALLKYSHRQDLSKFRASLRRWLSKKDPDWSERSRKARQDVTVAHTPGSDGTGELYATGPLEITSTIDLALTTYAAATKGELGGTADQRKLAALRDWAESYLASPAAPRQHGRPPTVNVTIDLATLLGLKDGLAEIPGVGAIPASAAAWLLADGAPLRRMVTDPMTGRCLDYGTDTYTVPPALAEQLVAIHHTSASPHSNVPAAGCDMEHNKPHGAGGKTNIINNTPVDRRWHRAKTHGDWTYEKDPNTDIVTWRSPTGLTCIIEPYDYRAGP